MFKSTSKVFVSKIQCPCVRSNTAGWGGRMLGAWALGIDYTGIDTNVNMKLQHMTA